MKKIGIMIVGLIFVVSMAQANVYVNWGSTGGFGYAPVSGYTGTPLLGAGASTVAQLIWSVDDVIDDAGIGGTVTGDDVLLASTTVSGDATGGWAYFGLDFDDGGAQDAGGYIYARIFQDDTIGAGDWFYAGAIVLASNLNPSDIPAPNRQSYDMNTAYPDQFDRSARMISKNARSSRFSISKIIVDIVTPLLPLSFACQDTLAQKLAAGPAHYKTSLFRDWSSS